MQLESFMTLWSFRGTRIEALAQATALGYEGIEGPVPNIDSEGEQFAEKIKNSKSAYIAEIATTGTYVPDRSLSLIDHIDYFQNELERLKKLDLNPRKINCLGGCDAWHLNDSIKFFSETTAIAKHFSIAVSYETHRGRCLFNPWVTKEFVARIPDLPLTLDMSHWDVVCEGMQQSEFDLIDLLSKNIRHIHGRVGYDQGPQVPDPRLGVYLDKTKQYMEIWQKLFLEFQSAERDVFTFTPEFGADGYQYRGLDGKETLVNLSELNFWINQMFKSRVSETTQSALS